MSLPISMFKSSSFAGKYGNMLPYPCITRQVCGPFGGTTLLLLFCAILLSVPLNAIAADSKVVPEVSPLTQMVPSLASPAQCTEDCLDPKTEQDIKATCPDVRSQILRNKVPKSGLKAGVYTELKNVTTLELCARNCCDESSCNFAFTLNNTCYLLNCVNGSEPCDPMPMPSEKNSPNNIKMLLIRNPKKSNAQDLSRNETCEVGLATNCKENERCVAVGTRSRNGVCTCEVGFVFKQDSKKCVAEMEDESTTIPSQSPSASEINEGLTVSVTSKNVTLPDNEVSLIAYAVPQAPPDRPYSYKWTLISNPAEDTAAVEGQTTDTLHLTGLKPGVYIFQVSVKSDETNGSTNATINVFAEKRLNHAPVAVISPQNQTIRLPTSSAVLDASLSTDDDKIISYKWELQKGPILFALSPTKVLNSTTLQVENLIPGNYTFKLYVEDTDHVVNSTTANITVIKEIDYPPTALPGKDIVVYLPQSEVTLNGNQSTDDKKIVDWEWKATGEQIKAVDMQDTHTPYLKLSHLQVGLYQFDLKVTDEAGQSNSATVHVIVKEASGNPPKADAGPDQTTVLDKQNWVLLDGSQSKSDGNKIFIYNWTQIRGPNNATIIPMPGGKANVSALTKGEYEFGLQVEDEAKLKANSTVKVTVIQRINEAPKARAGGNKSVRLPMSLVQLNGSSSSDDVKIVSWKWERQADSLAAGIILADSDKGPILQLTDLVPGNYVFKLIVKDEQGLSDGDIVTLTVEADTHNKDLVEIILAVPLTLLTESDKNKVVQQLALVLHDTRLVLNEVKAQLHTENAVLRLYGLNEKGELVNGSLLARQLRQRLYQDVGLLQFPIVSIDTVLCLDDCSGHGVCQDNPDGRECVCSAFWMENFLKKRFGNRERNCEWSKIYVGVVASLLLMMLFALIWSLLFIFRRNFRALKENMNGSASGSPTRSNGKRYHSQKKQYTLLDDEELELQAQDDEDAESEDSDSDILFETNKRSGKNGLKLLPLNGNGSVRNGILKNSRRVKT